MNQDIEKGPPDPETTLRHWSLHEENAIIKNLRYTKNKHHGSNIGSNLTLTSATSLFACCIVWVICRSNFLVCTTDRFASTLAVRSTKSIDPALRALKSSTRIKFRVSSDTPVLIKGISICFNASCLRLEMPASVRSPHALLNRSNPCLRITKDTTRPCNDVKKTLVKWAHRCPYLQSDPKAQQGNTKSQGWRIMQLGSNTRHCDGE